MQKTQVIAIFDAGKTNKKLFLFDDQYQILFQESIQIPEILDEDGFPGEDITSLKTWIISSMDRVMGMKGVEIRAVNFSAYGASLVYIDQNRTVKAPLYNYLKPFPNQLAEEFYAKYGGKSQFSIATASPALGNLNSGLQLYRLMRQRPDLFKQVRYALHLPQYLSSLLTGKAISDMTSIGCHTGLWDFGKMGYHQWVYQEHIESVLADIFPSDQPLPGQWKNHSIITGTGLHDSSAALIPYQLQITEPFLLLSTGTWCISLNPFNTAPLTKEELSEDCLCYLAYNGKPVKASRFFSGPAHDLHIKKLSAFFDKPLNHYQHIGFDAGIISKSSFDQVNDDDIAFDKYALSGIDGYSMAYHRFIFDMIIQQARATRLVLEGTGIKKMFVDGGFSRNSIYMQLLANAFPEMQVYAAVLPEATAIGTALAIHTYWNQTDLPSGLVGLKAYQAFR